MWNSLRHRWRVIARAGLLLAVALSLMAQPVFNALGEMHELIAHGDSAAWHAGDQPLQDATLHATGDGIGNPLHALLQYSHCCGQVVGLIGLEAFMPEIYWPDPAPADAMAQTIVSQRIATLFRPPIRA